MGLFNNMFTRRMNRNRHAKKPESFKYMYEVTANIYDGEVPMMEIKVKCPANNGRQAKEYFDKNIKFKIEKIVQDRRNTKRTKNPKRNDSGSY